VEEKEREEKGEEEEEREDREGGRRSTGPTPGTAPPSSSIHVPPTLSSSARAR
jgi:hypothetical protein